MAKRIRDDIGRLERDSERAPLDPRIARRMASALEASGRTDEALAWLTWWEALLDREWRSSVRKAGLEPGIHALKPDYLLAAGSLVEESVRAFAADQRRFMDSLWELVLGLQRASGAVPVDPARLPIDVFSSSRSTPSGFVPGDLIELVQMPDDPDPVPPGSRGRVTNVVRSFGEGWQVGVKWQDARRSISLEVPPDVADVIEPMATAAVGSFKGRMTLVQARLQNQQSEVAWVRSTVTMFHGEPRELGGISRSGFRQKVEYSGAHVA